MDDNLRLRFQQSKFPSANAEPLGRLPGPADGPKTDTILAGVDFYQNPVVQNKYPLIQIFAGLGNPGISPGLLAPRPASARDANEPPDQ